MKILFREYELLAQSGLFDAEYYVHNNPDVAAVNVDPLMHYLETGGRERRDPHAAFNTVAYLARCERVGQSPDNALLHYLTVGAELGLSFRDDGQVSPTAAAKSHRMIPPRKHVGECLLCIEAPTIIHGVVERARNVGLVISGWALAGEGVASIDVTLNGTTTEVTNVGMKRRDIQSSYPTWEHALHSGFSVYLPLDALSERRHEVKVTVHTHDGRATSRDFDLDVKPASEYCSRGFPRRKMRQSETDLKLAVLSSLKWAPSFRVVMASVTEAQWPLAKKTLARLSRQAYSNWTLHISLHRRSSLKFRKTARALLLAGLEHCSARVDLQVAANLRRKRILETRARPAVPAFYVCLMPGDELGCDALLEFALASAFRQDADFLYSDERRRDASGTDSRVLYKAPGSADTQKLAPDMGRAWCAEARLFTQIGLSLERLHQTPKPDLASQLLAVARSVLHSPKVLFVCDGELPPSNSPEDDLEPVEEIFAASPLFDRAAVRRILVIKLDFIGDCVTALPAMQRLREAFPKAHLTVLAASFTKKFWKTVPQIDEVLEFDIFPARSGLEPLEVAPSARASLQADLHARHFDLAIDLRKHPESRTYLLDSGAWLLAGFDHQDRFPWLDVALEWSEDVPLRQKRAHVSNDLRGLIDAIVTSCDEPQPAALKLNRKFVDRHAFTRELASRPLVCIHPFVGSDTRQWPLEKFVALIDEFCAIGQLNIAVVGGAEERSRHEDFLARCAERPQVFDLCGKLSLEELAPFLSRAVLYVGNNSGPKHLAAALRVPTVGIHSGVVDANEWGPLGAHAVAIRRNSYCSPCYIRAAEDCPRQMACLTGLSVRHVFDICMKLLVLRGGPSVKKAVARSSLNTNMLTGRAESRRRLHA